MTLTDLIAFAGEICLYMSTAGFILSLSAHHGSMIPRAAVMLLAECCCALCIDTKGVVRYLPALIMAPLFFTARSVPSALLPVPVLLLILLRAQARRWTAEYYTVRNLFQIGCAVYLLLFLGFAASEQFRRLLSDSLPFFVAWLLLTVLELRLLRDRYIAGLGASFKALNAALLLGVAFISLLLSSKPVTAAAVKAAAALWSRIAVPILIVLLYIFFMLLSLTASLLRHLWAGGDIEMESIQMESMAAMGDILGDLAPEDAEPSLWLARAAAAVGILLFVVIAWLAARGLVNRLPAVSETSGPLRREGIPHAEKRHRFVPRRTAAGGVRAVYRKYLALCKPLSIPVDGSAASDVIRDRSAPYAGAGNAEELRALWLRARFSDADIRPEDTKRAKQLLRQITKAISKTSGSADRKPAADKNQRV